MGLASCACKVRDMREVRDHRHAKKEARERSRAEHKENVGFIRLAMNIESISAEW